MKNIDLKNIFKKREEKVTAGPAMAYPVHFVRDWKIMVLCFAVGFIALSIFSWQIYLSNEIAGGYLSSEAVSTEPTTKPIDQKKLKANILIMETRQAEFLKIKANRSKLIDPSL
jgi:hypothetical protein